MLSTLIKEIRKDLIILRKQIFILKDNFPNLGSLLVYSLKILSNIRFIATKKFRLFQNQLKYGKLYFKKNYWVNPIELQFLSGIRENKWYNYSKVFGGNWDLSKKPFENTLIYRAFIQRFKNKKSWEDIDYYQFVLNKKIDENNILLNQHKKGVDKKFSRLESLYYEIKRNGIKAKREFTTPKGWFAKFDIRTIMDDISIDIGRDGQLLIGHGKHRLAIAKFLDLPSVPVVIIIRHEKWMNFRKNLIYFLKSYQEGLPCKIITHPDLQNIPFKKSKLSFEFIRENITTSMGRFLEFGAELGCFCHKFEEEGFECYAFEDNRIFLYFLEEIRKIEKKRFKILPDPISNEKSNQDLIFDVILALNGFYKYLATEETFQNLRSFLKRLEAKELICGFHNKKKFQEKDFSYNFTSEQFINFIIENSCFSTVKLIGKTKSHKSLYKFTV